MIVLITQSPTHSPCLSPKERNTKPERYERISCANQITVNQLFLITVQCSLKSSLVRFSSNVLNPQVCCHAASRRGLNAGAPGLSCTELSTAALSHVNSNGYSCWIALSRVAFPARSLATRTIPSLPAIRSSMMPSFHLFRLRSSSLIITTSPLHKGVARPACFKLCRSRRATRYSRLHRFQSASLHVFRYLALLRRSTFSSLYGSRSGRWLDF